MVSRPIPISRPSQISQLSRNTNIKGFFLYLSNKLDRINQPADQNASRLFSHPSKSANLTALMQIMNLKVLSNYSAAAAEVFGQPDDLAQLCGL